jgi:transposase
MGMENHQHKDVRLRRPDRDQMVMAMQSPDDLIGGNHRARIVWAVVAKLDLSDFYESIKARAGVVGRDATDPRLLVALWLYATIRGVGSARKLALLCRESDPYKWLCGGVSLNHHTLSDFRVNHAAALDRLFTQVIVSLVDKQLVKVYRISQDGTRVRACAGASSLRRRERLEKLLAEADAQVAQMKALLEDPERSASLSSRQKAARKRAARERRERLTAALAQLPELETKQQKLAKRVSKKQKAAGKLKQPRASTTDADARVMKMADGGFRPAVNMQFAVDTHSRAIVGVDVVSQGTDSGLSEPMRQQVQERTGQKVQEHLMDGGYLKLEEIDRAQQQEVTLFVPPKPPRNKDKRDNEYAPSPSDSEAVAAWRARMGSDEAQAIYKQRGATVETVNADLKTHRGLTQLTVRGASKSLCIGLWCALAYNVMHFGGSLLS